MPYGDSMSARFSQGPSGSGLTAVRGKVNFNNPVDSKTKSITYSATSSDLLLDLDATPLVDGSKTAPISAVRVRNDGYVPAMAEFVYNSYTAEGTIDTAASGLRYLKYLLNPNEEVILPTTRAIVGDAVAEWDGTAVTATAPNSNEYTDSGALTTEGFADDNDTTITFDDGSGGLAYTMFQINDLIRLDDEICRITSIVDTDGDGAYTPAHFIVERGVHGSTKADHTNNTVIRLPFFNAYHDFEKYSVAQSDGLGRFKANNFFGNGRAASGQGGITPGSVAISFYSQGYQKLGLSDITSRTETGMAESDTFYFKISIDGATATELSFATGTDTTFGAVVKLMQTAINTQFYTEGNLFQKGATVTIEGGDVVFRSNSFLSTSAIALSAGTSGSADTDELFDGTNAIARIPASPQAAVDARLEPELVYDPITNSSTYKQIFIRDDGYGNLIWKNNRKVGRINYESGAHDWNIQERPNAEFVISCLHTGPFSGKLDPTTAGRTNSLRQILGNTPQQKCEAILTVETF